MCSLIADSLTISDVDEVIRAHLMDQIDRSAMPSIPQLQCHNNNPYVRIIEQPASRNLRFRYECEGRSAGSIVGANSTPENRTHPTIQVMNYQGPFAVVVSAVTKEGPPYRPHPHNLVGREGCKRGVCTLAVNNQDMTYSFTSLGIQCVKKKDIEKSLETRERHNVDPFATGFGHRSQPGSIDLNVVRLCFQVFIKGPDGKFSQPLAPVVSDPIYDKKAMSDLTIMKLSHYSAPVCGGTEVILLCDRVAKEDIQVWFYEGQNSRVVWESQAEFQPSDVHKQVAIAFRTPRYYNENVQQPVPVFVELRRPSDNIRGEPRPFQFLPMERDPEGLARKRLKMEDSRFDRLLQANVLAGAQLSQERQAPIAVPRMLRQPVRQRIKVEPTPPSAAAGAASGGGGGATGTEYPVATMITMPMQYPTIPASVAMPLPVSPETITPHLTPVPSPSMAMSPGTHSYASSVSPPAQMVTGMAGASTLPRTLSPSAHSPLGDVSSEQQQPSPQQAVGACSNAVDEAMIEKFDSLGLDIDPSELTDFNISLAENLSTSLFDSANNIMETPLQDAVQAENHNMQPDDLNRIARIQNQLEKLCKDTRSD